MSTSPLSFVVDGNDKALHSFDIVRTLKKKVGQQAFEQSKVTEERSGEEACYLSD